MRRHRYFAFALFVTLILAAALPAVANEGQARMKLGYVLVEDEGTQSLYQETYNIYEGVNVSIEDLWYTMDSGLRLRANLENISLENRNLTFSLAKSQLFSFSFYDNKYRRIYGLGDGINTKREALGAHVAVSPVRQVKLYADYDLIDKNGGSVAVYEPISSPSVLATDFRQNKFTVGAEGSHFGGHVLLEYTGILFEDYARRQNDRSADEIRFKGTLPVPGYDRVVLSGGYTYRNDEVDDSPIQLRTDLAWGATKVYLPNEFLFDYRLVYAYSKHAPSNRGTENVFNTAAVSKSWSRRGGVRVGYENRWVSDRVDKRISNGVLFNAWFNHQNRLFLRALGGLRNDGDEKCTTLIGDQDYIRYQLTAKYAEERLGELSLQYQGRQREREELGTKVDYNMFAAEYGLERERYGRLTLSYAYYLGEFENIPDSFAFADQLVTARVYPAAFGDVTLFFGLIYFQSRRDLDIEKLGFDVGFAYALPGSFGVEAKYARYDYEDFQMTEFGDYASDVVEAYVTRSFDL